MLHDLGPAVAGALHDGVDALLGQQLGDGNAGHRGVAEQRHHGVAVASQHHAAHVVHADVQLLGKEGLEAARVQHAGHADDALAVEARQLVGCLRHGVQRIGDHDQEALGRIRDHLRDYVLHDLVVGLQQVVAAHARLAGNAGRDDDNVGVGRDLVAI